MVDYGGCGGFDGEATCWKGMDKDDSVCGSVGEEPQVMVIGEIYILSILKQVCCVAALKERLLV